MLYISAAEVEELDYTTDSTHLIAEADDNQIRPHE
jgi:hypothetical protein